MKRCPRCGETKDNELFYKNKRNADGLDCYCVECQTKRWKEYQKNNKEKIKAKKAVYDATHRKEKNERRKKYKDKTAEYNLAYSQKNKEKLTKNRAERYYKNAEESRERGRKSVNANIKTSYYVDKFPQEDGGMMVDGYFTVLCKYCGKRFRPKRMEAVHRHRSLKGLLAGEHNFYCSDGCKDLCPLYKFMPSVQTDPRSDLYVPKSPAQKVRACQGRSLKKIQCDEAGHNYCEMCGDIIDVELHHTLEISKYGQAAVSAASHMLLCKGCHMQAHADCKQFSMTAMEAQ